VSSAAPAPDGPPLTDTPISYDEPYDEADRAGDHGPRDDRAQLVAAELRPLVFQLYRAVRYAAPRLRLSASQGSALATLVGAGPMRIGQLADAEGVRLPSMTEIVARLERAGLVRRRTDPVDRRGVLVEVTTAGLARYQEAAAAREQFLHERLTELSPPDLAAIERALPAMRQILQASAPEVTPDITADASPDAHP
jgi:DNA-binding MarR family transcriptional regulator